MTECALFAGIKKRIHRDIEGKMWFGVG